MTIIQTLLGLEVDSKKCAIPKTFKIFDKIHRLFKDILHETKGSKLKINNEVIAINMEDDHCEKEIEKITQKISVLLR